MLEADRERYLFERYTEFGDLNARDEIILAHDPLARRAARQAARSSALQFDDCHQEARVAIVAATEKFDPSRGARFSTLAALKVSAAITRFKLEYARTTRLCTNKPDQKLIRKLPEAVRKIETETGAPITVAGYAQIATTLGRDLSDVLSMAARLAPSDSRLTPSGTLDGERGRYATTPQQLLISDFHDDLEDRIDARRLMCFAIGLVHQMYFGTKLKVALAWLSGKATKDGRKALGQELGLSADRIRRIEDEVRCNLLDELKYQIFDAA